MSYHSGGGRNSSGGGGGRGRGRGRGTGARNNNNYTAGRGGRGDVPHAPRALLKPCGHFVKGNCSNGNNCHHAHIVKLHARIDASSPMPQDPDEYQKFNSHQKNMAAVSSVAIWETQGVIKIFTGSHDGFWRLWNTSVQPFQKEFESHMGGGKVECLQIASNYLFCGFEAVSKALPGTAMVGMIHAWNLARPNDPPLELNMHKLMPYAHASRVTQLAVVGADVIVSGCYSGVIRLWKFDAGAFQLTTTIHGHATQITGLVVVDNLLWSASTDGSIRLWDLNNSGDCQYVITQDTGGHTGAVTGLVSCIMPGAGTFVLSSSLDGTIKAWNGANGECVASEEHGSGVVSMALSKDLANNPILLIGLDSGNIMVRNLIQTPKVAAFGLIFTLTPSFSTGHYGAVRCIAEGPAATIYSGGEDGKLLVLQITGDLGL